MVEAALDKTLYDVLNAIMLKKMAPAKTVADVLGSDPDAVDQAFRELADRDFVMLVGESAMPTDQALPILVTAATHYYDHIRQDPVIMEAANKFEDINARFLQAMSSWQQIEMGGKKVANDHQDASYDAKVITKMERLISRLQSVLVVIAERDQRFARYSTRFDRAIRNANDGEVGYISSPTLDSVHNIWFEFHEDLLRTLGRARKE